MLECNNVLDRFSGWSCEIHDPFTDVIIGGRLELLQHYAESASDELLHAVQGSDSIRTILADISTQGESVGISSASQVPTFFSLHWIGLSLLLSCDLLCHSF